jgi:hypothetical protein
MATDVSVFRDGGQDGETRAPDSPRPLTQRRPSTTAQDLSRGNTARTCRPLKGRNAREAYAIASGFGKAIASLHLLPTSRTLPHYHARRSVWPLFSREAGRDAVPSELKQVARHARPAGDFCSRLFRCSPSLTLNLPKGSHSEQVQHSSRGLCTFYRHAGVIVPPGEPLDGTSPAMMPRRHHSGGAGSSPRNHRHDRCSRWEELTGSMEDGKRAWRNRQKKIAGSAEISDFRRLAGVILSMFSGRVGPFLRHSRPRDRQQGAESVGNDGVFIDPSDNRRG